MASSTKYVSGYVGSFNGTDWYSLGIVGTQTLDIDLGLQFGSATVTLYNSAGSFIQNDSGSTTADAWINRVVTAGLYYVTVASSSDAAYTLSASFGTPAVGTSATQAAGPSLATARPLYTLNGTPIVIADWVGPGNPDDYYSFSVGAVSTLQLTLAGVTTTTSVQVLNASGQVLTSFSATPTSNGSLYYPIAPIAAGTYYLHVAGSSSTATGYSLTIADPAVPDAAGDGFATARDLGTLASSPLTLTDTLSDADTIDEYAFRVSTPSTVTLSLTGLTGGATIDLYNATQNRIASISGSETAEAWMRQDLVPLPVGTYYAQISRSGGSNVSYTLTATAVPDADIAGNSPATSRGIGPLSGTPIVITEPITPTDAGDDYSFTLPTAATVYINLSSYNGFVPDSASLQLYDSASNAIGSRPAANASGSVLAYYNLAAGTYTAAITGTFSSSTPTYTVAFSTGTPPVGTPAADGAGNDRTSARDLGNLSGASYSLIDWLGTADPSDWYLFSLSGPSLVKFDLAAPGAGDTITLYNASGAAIVSSSDFDPSAANGTGASIWRTLDAGSYYIAATSVRSHGYNLAASATLIPDPAGSGLGTALNVGALGTVAKTYSDYVGPIDVNDYYQFTLSGSSRVSLDLSGLASGATMTITDISGNTLYSLSANPASVFADAVGVLDPLLAAGTYFLEVSSGSPNSYTVSLAATPLSDPGGPSLSAADNLGAIRVGAVSKDLDANGTSDLILRNAASGTNVAWLLSGPNITSAAAIGGDLNWSLIGSGDFNGDGHADLLWRNSANNVTYAWLMNGTTQIANGYLGGDPNWSITATGDFNGDGKTDLIWHNVAGSTVMWFMNGTTNTGAVAIGADPAWSVIGTGDFDGNGTADLLWRNSATGLVSEWLMSGATALATRIIGGDLNWTPTFTGDFNGDGRDDIIWRNAATGTTALWQMNGLNVTRTDVIGGDTNWSVANAGDYDGDGKSDLIWRNTAGSTVMWQMNGATITNSTVIFNDPGWRPAV